ncbi:hypothetical protein TNCV_3855691 [Trichonephila clavipes]|nr:hypothetical protein TNCV_3855691 [Trichonephila clavipes]
MKEIKKLKEEIRDIMTHDFRTGGKVASSVGVCGEPEHLRSNCPRNNTKDRSTKRKGCGGAGYLRNSCPRVNEDFPHHASVIESKEVRRNRKGLAHGNTDALSRTPCPESCKYC